MLDDLKRILGIAPEDTDLDDKLNWIISSVRSRLKLLLGGTDPPEEMNYIIVEVAVVRFNRIGSEGTAAHTVEGESLTFSDSDFDAYMAEIRSFKDSLGQRGRKEALSSYEIRYANLLSADPAGSIRSENRGLC